MIDILLRYREGFISGILVTLKLAGIVWVVGLVVGTFLGYLVAVTLAGSNCHLS